MDYDFQLYKLSEKFWEDYPNEKYPEILTNKNRAYTCLVIEYNPNYFICIPFRTNITHNNSFHFKDTIRSRKHKSGLDYSKTLIIQDIKYFDDSSVLIDRDEYLKTRYHIRKIVEQVVKYIDDYILHIKNERTLNQSDFDRKYSHSTLIYFHDILLQ